MMEVPEALKSHLLGIEAIFHEAVQQQVADLEKMWQHQFHELDQEREKELKQAHASESREREMKEKSLDFNRKLEKQVDQLQQQLSAAEKKLVDSRKETDELRRKLEAAKRGVVTPPEDMNGTANAGVHIEHDTSARNGADKSQRKKSASSTGSTRHGQSTTASVASYQQSQSRQGTTIRSQVTTATPVQFLANPHQNTFAVQQPMGGVFYQNQSHGVPQAPNVMFGNPLTQGGAFKFYPSAHPPEEPEETHLLSLHADSESSQIFDMEAERNMKINAKKGPMETVLPAGAKAQPMKTLIPSEFMENKESKGYGPAPVLTTPKNEVPNPMKTILPAGYSNGSLQDSDPSDAPFSVEPSKIHSSERLRSAGGPRIR